MGDHDAKRALFEELSRVGKALASPIRLELLDVLTQGERSVEELATETATTVASCSAHLQTLRHANLVSTRREGTRIHYRLAGQDVARLAIALRDVATAHIADVPAAARRYLGGEVEQIDREELQRRLQSGEVVVVDVRPEPEYEAGHIPGAVSIPVDDLARRLDELPPDAEIVAYCRGPYCVFAHDAVRHLTGSGRRARRLADGLPEWRDAGLPVAAGTSP